MARNPCFQAHRFVGREKNISFQPLSFCGVILSTADNIATYCNIHIYIYIKIKIHGPCKMPYDAYYYIILMILHHTLFMAQKKYLLLFIYLFIYEECKCSIVNCTHAHICIWMHAWKRT